MIKLLQWVGAVSFSCIAISFALAQTSAPPAPNGEQASGNPVCVRLEGQLAALSRGGADPRTDQIKHYEDAAAKQQADLDRSLTQSKRLGCENGGFFSLFTGGGPQCQPINAQIQQMRDNLDRTMSELERLKSGSNDREGPRRALIGQLAQNNCGQQYQAAAAAGGARRIPRRIVRRHDHKFGRRRRAVRHLSHRLRTNMRRILFPGLVFGGAKPLSDDQRACQRECPATETALYTYRNPGEDINQAVSLGGQPYTALPNAFRYRKEYSGACSCRRPGQSWADALKNSDDATTLESGDIVVTDQNAKALSQPPAPKPPGKPSKGGAANSNANQNPGAATAPPAAANPGASTADSAASGVRSIGPPFVVGH